jgi:uncharacterized protein YndB with AHSA1/START domain
MSNTHQLYIERMISASPEKLFQAWTEPDLLCQWMGPGTVQCKEASVDLKIGGIYRIHMVSEEGDHIATGKYIEIEKNKKLLFTWGWEGGEVQDTRVTVTFEKSENKTKLGILHEKFSTREAAEKHTFGWNGCLDKLINFVGVISEKQ